MLNNMIQLSFSLKDLPEIAIQNIVGQLSISGVQRKISLVKKNDIFEATNTGGEYILKPADSVWDQVPENEHLCMSLAYDFNINVPENMLVKLADESRAYVVKRFDREKKVKFPVEDFCQVLNLSSVSKYSGSYENIVKGINLYSSAPGLDKIIFFRMLIFNFLICNNDAHYKNFSLIDIGKGYRLSPAYDLVNTFLILANPREEFALSLSGKKNGIKVDDFIQFSEYMDLPEKVVSIEFERISKTKDQFIKLINKSFLTDEKKKQFQALYSGRFSKLTKGNS